MTKTNNKYHAPQYLGQFNHGHNGTGMLLLHGFMGTPVQFGPIIDAFTAKGYTVHVPLLPGFGHQIDTLGERRYQEWLMAARKAWIKLSQEHSYNVLVGHSMGGALAILLATDHPPDRLVLTAPFWRFDVPLWKMALLPVAKYAIKDYKVFSEVDFDNDIMRGYLEKIMPEADLDDPDMQYHIRHEITIPMQALDELRKVGLAAFRAAPNVISPTLIIQGLQDTTVRPYHTETLIGQFKYGIETHTIATGTHDLVQSFSPHHAEVIEQIEQFVARVTA